MATAGEEDTSLRLTSSENEIVKTFCNALSERGEALSWQEAVKLVAARKFDSDRALQLYEHYKELRTNLELDSLMPTEDPLRSELASGKFTILDATSKEGCRLALFTAKLFKPLTTPEEKRLLLQNILFNVDECLNSSAALRNGIILLINLEGAGGRISDRHLATEILDLLQDSYPARVHKVYVVDAPWWARVLYNLIWPFLKEKTRSRVEMVTQLGLQRHVQREILPVSLGGDQPSTHDEWIRLCSTNYVQRHRVKVPARHKSVDRVSSEQEGLPQPPARRSSLGKKKPLEIFSASNECALSVSEIETLIQTIGDHGLQSEYATIRMEPPKGHFTETRKPYNQHKNRYADIHSYDETRVHLQQQTNQYGELVPGSDFINANFVASPKSPKAYIAAQGPLPATFEDWWRMAWEYNVQVIVMTTRLVERGRVKCDEYWPVNGGAARYGRYTVEMVAEQLGRDYCTRQFQVTLGGETRTITHYQFIAWPDFGLPATASSMLEVIALMHETNSAGVAEGNVEPPVIIHCSAGVGRTGTLMATDICSQCLLNTGKCDIPGTVRFIRAQRAFAVQTPEQYQFIFMAVLEYAESQGIGLGGKVVIEETSSTAVAPALPPIPQETATAVAGLMKPPVSTGDDESDYEQPVDEHPEPLTVPLAEPEPEEPAAAAQPEPEAVEPAQEAAQPEPESQPEPAVEELVAAEPAEKEPEAEVEQPVEEQAGETQPEVVDEEPAVADQAAEEAAEEPAEEQPAEKEPAEEEQAAGGDSQPAEEQPTEESQADDN